LWRRGSWSALGLALGFAALVNLTLVAGVVWPELFPEALRKGSWAALVVVWVGSVVVARWREGDATAADRQPEADDPYRQATQYYLQGSWFEAECALAGLLRRNPRDVDAALMLATLYRHAGRLDDAARQLAQLERFDEAAKWALEIDRERRWLAAAQDQPAAPPQPSGGPGETTSGD